MSDSASTDQASAPPAAAETIKITVKSSADAKYPMDVSPSILVSDFKQLLEPLSSIPKERQRLIYSGRVLKDAETLASYKIQTGHTIHLVKSAAPAASSATSGSGAAAAATPAVPQNIAAGQGAGNPLAGLTGARYAGLAQLPSASMFGPDGGMGPPPSEEQLIDAMSNPMVQQSMNQMLQNPQMLEYIINSSPNLQGMGPQVREMMQSEQFRQMMTNPEMMRQMMNMNRMMGGAGFPGLGGFGGAANNSFPEPGRTENTTTPASTDANATNAPATGAAPAAAAPNLFANLFAGAGGNAPAAGNPFGALFGNPAANSGQAAAGGAPAAGTNPLWSPEMMNLMAAGLGGGAANSQPEDTRPPEERYESQLRQLNELGFFDFDRNVRALRRSGGNVQGAVEALLDGAV
ncbi:ubiquitin-like polyubiquitin-binding protein [Myxozyma melibiosi]|uniref:Ubiquitin-like polyubiquitin-binding protein n=1 Tax=Myxozyma melibiosi TaxID=54550 RepID=A0ABR1FFA7_9ASCO